VSLCELPPALNQFVKQGFGLDGVNKSRIALRYQPPHPRKSIWVLGRATQAVPEMFILQRRLMRHGHHPVVNIWSLKILYL
jgi:hypothetical protein